MPHRIFYSFKLAEKYCKDIGVKAYYFYAYVGKIEKDYCSIVRVSNTFKAKYAKIRGAYGVMADTKIKHMRE